MRAPSHGALGRLSRDACVRAQVSFADMNLSTPVLRGLTDAGFERPSIGGERGKIGLRRVGFDPAPEGRPLAE